MGNEIKNILPQYWKAGLSTLPTKEDKSPDVKDTWKDGISDIELYNYGVGIICGAKSDNLECMDFDNHFGDAKKILSEFMTGEAKEIYDKYKLPIESTVSGGFHLLYRCDKIEGNQKLASRPKKDSKGNWVPDTIIETRGEGGYFVADPTNGYKIIKNSLLDIQCIEAGERDILLDTARSFNTWHKVVKTDQENTDRPGDLFNSKSEAIDEARSALLRAGWTEARDKEWRRPDKNKGISATFGKVAPGILYCFSSNAYPFEPNSAYTPFQIVSLLNYKGDFSAFAKELSERYKTNSNVSTVKEKKEEQKEKTDTQLTDILRRARIDLDMPVVKPPVIMRIKNNRLFTLGNFSAITGKSKSKKGFLTNLLMASATANGNIQDMFFSSLPKNKEAVILFDTEQSEYDAYIAAKRVWSLTELDKCDNFGAFDLREYSPHERCRIIDFAFNKFESNIGYVVIDGIADLALAINDEEEATRVVSLLLRWTKKYNCHITVVIHQNKNDNFATGHLGSSIMKKAECVISVEKVETDPLRSIVKCDYMRGAAEFEDFYININEKGLPEIV